MSARRSAIQEMAVAAGVQRQSSVVRRTANSVAAVIEQSSASKRRPAKRFGRKSESLDFYGSLGGRGREINKDSDRSGR